jgi:putative SOS response-associated peptidase YedK
MCGRYTDTKRNKAMLASVGIQADLGFVPRYNIAPTQEASIVVLGDGGAPEHKCARWGLIPVWAKSEPLGISMINARSETVAEKASFRTAYHKRRCLVLADGFMNGGRGPKASSPSTSGFATERHSPSAAFGRRGETRSGWWRASASSRSGRTNCAGRSMIGCRSS